MNRRIHAALLGAFVLLLLAAVPVLGHAELVESDPPEGGTIETPYTLTATFSEELLERSNIVVDNAAGDEVARAEPDPGDRTMIAVELPDLPPGDYVANWTARTADGHTERGQIHFSVAAPATPSPSPSPTAEPTPTGAPTPTPSGRVTSAPVTPPPTATPTSVAAPSASPQPVVPAPGAAGGDAVVAVAIGAVAIGAIALFLFARTRR